VETEPTTSALDSLPLLEVSGDCLALFTTKVQPILMNTCANCHSSGRGGRFVLTRSTDAAGRRATQINLSAVLREVCFEKPASSPLLFKACSAHGGSQQPPLGTNQATPFETLKNWVELVAHKNSHLGDHGVQFTAAQNLTGHLANEAKGAPSTGATVEVQGSPEFRSIPFSADAASPAATSAPVPLTTTQQSRMPLVTGNNPYDPTVFNALYHPKQ
jgi:hypothetical protein